MERVGLEDGGTYVCTAETDTNTVHKTVQVMRNTAKVQRSLRTRSQGPIRSGGHIGPGSYFSKTKGP